MLRTGSIRGAVDETPHLIMVQNFLGELKRMQP
jgi:hypothetical protein